VTGGGKCSTRLSVIVVWYLVQTKILSILEELGPFRVLVVQDISPPSCVSMQPASRSAANDASCMEKLPG
jgi:hypothetical protein